MGTPREVGRGEERLETMMLNTDERGISLDRSGLWRE